MPPDAKLDGFAAGRGMGTRDLFLFHCAARCVRFARAKVDEWQS